MVEVDGEVDGEEADEWVSGARRWWKCLGEVVGMW